MNKTQRTQIAKQLRAAAQKLLGTKDLPGDKWDEAGVQDAIKELVTAALGRDDTAETFKLGTHDFWLIDDAVLGAHNVKKAKKHPSDDKKLLARITKEVKAALGSSSNGASASTVSAAFSVLLLGDRAGTAETLAEVPGPSIEKAVKQALKLVVDPEFDLSMPEHKPKVKVEQRQGSTGPVDVAWVSFGPYENLLVLPVTDAKKWKQIAIRQGGDSLGAKAKVKAAAGVKVEKPGQLRDGIWEGESVSFVTSLSDFLDSLGLKHVAEFAKDGHIEVNDAPSARELTDYYGKKTSSEAITCFPDAARHAYMTAMESGIEAYMVKHISEGVIDLLNEINGTADYEGEDSAGEAAIVKQPYSVTAEETGDVDGIYSDPYIKVTIDEPLHLSNGVLADLRITSPQSVDEPFGAVSMEGDLAYYLKDEFSREVKNLGEIDSSNADMDKDIFDEFFAQNVLEMDPGEIAEAIQTYADDSDESVEDVVDQMMKDIPGLSKMSGAIASALEGGYDARQQKLPLKGAMKALAAAEAAIKAAGNPIANIREKRAAAAKRGDTKAISYWNEKLRNALSKGPAPSSTTKSKAVASVSASVPKVTPKQFAGYKKAERDGGISFNDGYNVPTYGITQAVFNIIRKCIETMAGGGHSSGASLAEINKLLAGSKVQLAYADPELLKQAAQVLSGSISAARKLTPKQQKKLNDQRIQEAYGQVASGVQINIMDIPKVFEVGEKAIAEGADDAALEKAIHTFVQKIKQN